MCAAAYQGRSGGVCGLRAGLRAGGVQVQKRAAPVRTCSSHAENGRGKGTANRDDRHDHWYWHPAPVRGCVVADGYYALLHNSVLHSTASHSTASTMETARGGRCERAAPRETAQFLCVDCCD